MKHFIKNLGILIICIIGFLGFYVNAQGAPEAQGGDGEGDTTIMSGYSILPDLTPSEIETINKAINEIGNTGGHVMETYREKADDLTLPEQVSSGIMNRDTIMNYLVYVIKFLSQAGITVGIIFIMYAGVKYMISVFNNNSVPKGVIKNAILGVIIVIFSYAILKALMLMVGFQ